MALVALALTGLAAPAAADAPGPPASTAPAAAPTAAAAPAPDFTDDARRFHRLVACAGDEPVAPASAKVVARHCAKLARKQATFRTRFVEPASAFFAAHRPAGLPTTVVYPFGGGDLASALVTFPDATEITTISLERAGDPRRLRTLGPRRLETALASFRTAANGLLTHSVSKTVELRATQRDAIPTQLGLFVVGAATLGFRPTRLRYFHLADDGGVVYDADGGDFANLELTLQDDAGRVVVHRHLAANLADGELDGSPTLRYLEARGKVSVIVKSASYLLWFRGFSTLRAYLAANLAWMVSDSTGLHPAFAARHGLEQETWGRFAGAALRVTARLSDAMAALWRSQPTRPLAFRFGYRDRRSQPHLLITRPRASAP